MRQRLRPPRRLLMAGSLGEYYPVSSCQGKAQFEAQDCPAPGAL